MATATPRKTRPKALPIDATPTVVPEVAYAAPNTPTPPAVGIEVPLAWLVPNPFNPRRTFADDALDELAASLTQHGMLQPIVVREVAWPDTMQVVDAAGQVTPCYEIIAGERRWRAATRAGLATVPIRILTNIDDAAALQLCVVENLQRADLDPIEQAQGYAALRDQAGMTQTQIAAMVKRSQPVIARALSLLRLPADVQEYVRTGKLSHSHAEALRDYAAFPPVVSAIAAVAVKERWTLKQIEDRPHTSYSLLYHPAKPVRTIGFNDGIDRAVCEQCPYGAYRQDQGRLTCLRPDHYDELAAAAKAAQEATVQAVIAEKEAGGATVLDLRTHGYSNVTDLGIYTIPPGCTADCPCRVAAIDRWGKPTQACTEPARFDKLRTAAERAKSSARNKLARARHAHALQRIDAAELREVQGEPGIRELALVASMALSAVRGKAGELVAKRRGMKAIPDRDGLIGLAATDILRLVAEVILTSSMLDATEGEYGNSGLLTWYLGGWTPADVNRSASASENTAAICPECSEEEASGK